ncbi:MAG: hypothetical protein H7A51_07045 [Akkermansiaceae bacterium]|nr:hypothetical protein [Akkermansiaceae bacterium]
MPTDLLGLCVYEPFAGLHAIRAAAKGRLTSYLDRGVVDRCGFQHPTLENLEGVDRRSIHFLLRRGNLLVGSIRGTAHQFKNEKAEWFCSDILERSSKKSETDKIIEFVRAIEPESRVYFEVSGWYMNPDIRSERIFSLLMPAMVWAFTSCFSSPFPAFASLRDSNGAAKMLIRLGGLEIPGCCFHDAVYKGRVKLLGLHSHEYAPLLNDIVCCLQSLLKKMPIQLTSVNHEIQNKTA